MDNVRIQKIDWMNEHGTYRRKGVQRFLPIASSSGQALDHWRRVGQVLQDIVGEAFAAGQPLRPDGSRWSLSNIGMPNKLALSLAAHDVAEQVPASWCSSIYTKSLDNAERTAMLVSGSMKIRRLNRLLAMRDLALRTSGASDGQTLAGATATGTHGAAIQLGAIHDTIRAVHLMTAPNQTVLVQPSSQPLKEQAAKDLGAWLGLPTKLLSDDQAYHAALVHLGSLGIVLNMVIEVSPLYFMTSTTTPHVDDAWKTVLSQRHPGSVPGHSKSASFVEVVINPYKPSPKTQPKAWVVSMKNTPYNNQSGVLTRASQPEAPNPDLLSIISSLAELDDIGLSDAKLRSFMTDELVSRYGTQKRIKKALPGVMFGPTALPRGSGDSVEFVVDGSDAKLAVEAILAALEHERKQGRQFLGAIGVRFVAGSKALLAPNARRVSCFIELPGVRTDETSRIYQACGDRLTASGINYGCHWGQHLVDIKRSLKTWWGDQRVSAWQQARRDLLTPQARTIFASPVLKTAGLV